MLDDDGKEVPGTKGYKCVFAFRDCFSELNVTPFRCRYFGRAKELPGVKELFQSRKKDEDEENQAQAFYKKFMNQGPTYFGDLDEQNSELLKFEMETEQDGTSSLVI